MFAENISENVFVQNIASFCKIWIITLFFQIKANFFAENWRKPQSSVIMTSTLDLS
jgi:hypothetical protein